MTHSQLQAALAIARSHEPLDITGLHFFEGFALKDYQPVTCTLQALAALVRWQCLGFDGSVDAENLDEITRVGRHRFRILDDDSGKAVA